MLCRVARFQQGKPNEAIKLRPGFEEARYQLVLIYESMGDLEMAEHHFKIMRQMKDRPQ